MIKLYFQQSSIIVHFENESYKNNTITINKSITNNIFNSIIELLENCK